jgi:sugar phosphate isomerase/epimerase
VPDTRFGVSTHLFHEQRLSRDHLVEIAAHGFEVVELFATRSHFDYRDSKAVDQLAEWLSDTRLTLHSVHAPAFEALLPGDQWVGPYSNASANDAVRRAAVAEADAALKLAGTIPFRYLVTHIGVPDSAAAAGGDNQAAAARRSVEELVSLSGAAGVKLALEVIPNALSTAPALTRLLEDELEGIDAGVCLDYGHAHLMGDLAETIEALSGHLWTTHVHDNRGSRDEHLAPYSGTIDWDAAMMETMKIGYDGPLVFEVRNTGDLAATLARMVRARERLEQTFVVF